VGINPAVVQYDKGVFGEDAHEFKPERWLESEGRTRAMEKAVLTFGAGTRTCTGKNVCIFPPFVRRRDRLTDWYRWRFRNCIRLYLRFFAITV
jgi:hypothetical protein